jgi:hypothetical protein
MENWLESTKQLYRTTSTPKEYNIYADGVLLLNGANIVTDSVKITQSISDSEQLTYGAVEAAQLEFKFADSGEFPVGVVPATSIQLATSSSEPVITAPPEAADFMLRTAELKGTELTVKQLIGGVEVPIEYS